MYKRQDVDRKCRVIGLVGEPNLGLHKGGVVAGDALLDAVRERRAAGGMLPAVNTWQPTVLSMMVGLMVQINQLSERIQALEERHRHD